jgi:hypothetical protein
MITLATQYQLALTGKIYFIFPVSIVADLGKMFNEHLGGHEYDIIGASTDKCKKGIVKIGHLLSVDVIESKKISLA